MRRKGGVRRGTRNFQGFSRRVWVPRPSLPRIFDHFPAFSGIIIQVGFLDSLTTNCDHSLPLTLGELTEFGDAKRNIEHWKYIKSYSPYHNIKKMDYPNLLLVTNLKDVRVLFDEPTKFTAKLRQYKTDNNLLLLKCELEDAGHGGKSGRDSAIEEIAFDYSFILKITNKLNT